MSAQCLISRSSRYLALDRTWAIGMRCQTCFASWDLVFENTFPPDGVWTFTTKSGYTCCTCIAGSVSDMFAFCEQQQHGRDLVHNAPTSPTDEACRHYHLGTTHQHGTESQGNSAEHRPSLKLLPPTEVLQIPHPAPWKRSRSLSSRAMARPDTGISGRGPSLTVGCRTAARSRLPVRSAGFLIYTRRSSRLV